MPAAFKLPTCEAKNTPHLGSFFATDGSFMTVETCPGTLLTIMSNVKAAQGDENSWLTFFQQNFGPKMLMTLILVGFGAFKFYQIKNKK